MQCPFIRGESTDNVPISLTDASHPAIQVLEDQYRDQVVCLGTSYGSHLGGVATEQGHVILLDLIGKLTISVSSEMEPVWFDCYMYITYGLMCPGPGMYGLMCLGPSTYGLMCPGPGMYGLMCLGPSTYGLMCPGPGTYGLMCPGTGMYGLMCPGPGTYGLMCPGPGTHGLMCPGPGTHGLVCPGPGLGLVYCTFQVWYLSFH